MGITRLEMSEGFYNEDVDTIREREYPMLKESTYLDHSGTTLYAKSLIEEFATSMTTGLYGNPHSGSASSLRASKLIDNVRLRALQFMNADPEDFDLVFVANATAAIKLVAEGFAAGKDSFSYLYHRDSHTSLVGVREHASKSHCLESDEAVKHWLTSIEEAQKETSQTPVLFAYPAQSNMNGRRLPLIWSRRVREARLNAYTLLDAAALVSTAQLDLSDSQSAPDFTALSFYKIFGFPDLGALIVRKSSSHILTSRKYFGGGTVEMVSCLKEAWHVPKMQSVHEQLEDGTLPIHSILALNSAFDVHSRLYGSMDQISKHTSSLAQRLYQSLSELKHFNGQVVCKIYTDSMSAYESSQQGPVIAFNIQDSNGNWVANSEVEKIASIINIHLRIGGLCNPGGISHHLDLKPWELETNFAAGQRCGDNNLGVGGKPTGVIRVSLGAMSNLADVTTFIGFVREFFVEEKDPHQVSKSESPEREKPSLFVESLTVYPIKSCSGWSVPANIEWEVKQEGLAFDREWCLVHSGTGRVLSQKRYPRMALLKPEINLNSGLLRVRLREYDGEVSKQISVPLDHASENYKIRPSNLCSTAVDVSLYNSTEIGEFFTSALGVPCNLARFPTSLSGQGTRHSKPHLQKAHIPRKRQMEEEAFSVPGSFPTPPPSPDSTTRPVLLSNESPILCITRASLDCLNSHLVQKGSEPVHHAVFRANIVVASSSPTPPYMEDDWASLTIGEAEATFEMLGRCQRCSMVCVNQVTAEKSQEPFVTLAKTRRFDNKVYFGEHMCLAPGSKQKVFIKAGDKVKAFVSPT